MGELSPPKTAFQNRTGNACAAADRKLLNCLALLVSYCAGSLASRLAGRLALAAAALSSGSLKISLVDGSDVLQKEHLFLVICITVIPYC